MTSSAAKRSRRWRTEKHKQKVTLALDDEDVMPRHVLDVREGGRAK